MTAGAMWDMEATTVASTFTLEKGNLSVISPPPMVVVSKGIMFYSLAAIIPFGLVCNTLSIFIFMSKSLRVRAASWYLAALAVSDDIALVTVMVDYWLKDYRIGLPIILSSNGFCIVITYLSHASRLLSAMLVMSFTIERFIGVVFPLKRAALSSTAHARRLVLGELIACTAMTSFCAFTIGVDEMSYGKECDVLPDMAKIYLIFNTIFLVFGSIVIPILVIFSLNMFILYKVYQRKVLFRPRNMRFGGGMRQSTNKATRHFNIATLLLVVSSTFVILNAPYCISWFILFFHHYKIGSPDADDTIPWHLFAAKYVSSVPYYLNYSINFLLYSLCARAFRVALMRVFTCRDYFCGLLRSDQAYMDTRQTVMDQLCMEQRFARGVPKKESSKRSGSNNKMANGTDGRTLKVSDMRHSSRSRSSDVRRSSHSRSSDGPRIHGGPEML